MITFFTSCPEETALLGEKIARTLKPGDVIGFTGDLGAGKTCIIKGLCRWFGVKEDVSSPTFTLINEYRGTLPLYHFDLYRICEEDLEDLGYWEYFDRGGICLLEWADRAENLLPEDYIKIHLEYLEDTDYDNFSKRKISISGREEFSALK